MSFELKEGEALGIIGRNGAGKSTLLKILSRITPPSTGRAVLRGRVASLLEVGTGFHPELSGRENIYLNGTLLGMSRQEIDRKLEEIVEFAGVARFLDTPIKRYSSGMQVRLAFSVAAHLDAEVLVVDEVLAVGDLEFQRKCLGRMGNLARSGRTVLFVSHNMTAVEALCERCLLLEHGLLRHDGAAREVVQRYLTLNGGSGTGTWHHIEKPMQMALTKVRLRASGRESNAVRAGDAVEIELHLAPLSAEPLRGKLGISLTLDPRRRASGQPLDALLPVHQDLPRIPCRRDVPHPQGLFGQGHFNVSMYSHWDEMTVEEWASGCLNSTPWTGTTSRVVQHRRQGRAWCSWNISGLCGATTPTKGKRCDVVLRSTMAFLHSVFDEDCGCGS